MKKTKSLSAVLLIALFSVTVVGCKSKKKLVKTDTETSIGQASSDKEVDDYKKQLPGTDIQRTAEGLRIIFSSEILFNTNSSILTAQAKESVKDLVNTINKHGEPNVQIQGHTDATGTSEYNKWLSDKRAVSVKTYAESLGIPGSRIQTAGFGDTKPLAPNNTPEGRAKNRRVEVIIMSN